MTDIKEMRALHEGFVQKRTWHKIKWIKGKHAGKIDLFTEEDLQDHKDSVEIIETFKTDKCATGVSYDFGSTPQAKIDEWIKNNKK